MKKKIKHKALFLFTELYRKKTSQLNIAFLFLLCFLTGFSISAQTSHTGMRNITPLELTADMGLGWNLGNTMDAYAASSSGLNTQTVWGNPLTTKAMIDKVKQQGFKTIRIPITWYQHVESAPNYKIDIAWLNRVEEIMNYAFDNDMYVIINTHHEEGEWLIPTYAKQLAATNQLKKIWTQVANRFKDYGDYLIFETINEPRVKGGQNEWNGGTQEVRDVVNAFNKSALDAIRATGGNNLNRFIMCPTVAASASNNAINGFIIPNNDNKVIVSIHTYSPYNFTLNTGNGSTSQWGSTSDKSDLDAEMQKIYDKFISKGIAVVLGEWGSKNKNNATERSRHAAYYVNAAKSRKMPTVVWDDGGDFKLLNRNAKNWYFPLISDAITEHNNVVVGINGISVINNSLTLTIGQEKTVTYSITPNNATDKSVQWTTNDPTIATVNNNGLIKALKAGNAIITVTTNDGNKKAQANVTITSNPLPNGTQMISLLPIEDAYLENSKRINNNFLRIEKGKRVTYFKYDISNINGNITEAKLKLTCGDDVGNGYIKINLGTESNWNEDNLNNSNKPIVINEIGHLNTNYVKEQSYTWELNSESFSNKNVLNFVMEQTNGNDVSFYSKEGDNQKRPTLILTYNENNSNKILSRNNQDTDNEDIQSISYPNPFTDVLALRIDKKKSISNIKLLDVNGRIFYEKALNGSLSEVIIPTNKLNPGLYYIKLIGKQKTIIHRVIKK